MNGEKDHFSLLIFNILPPRFIVEMFAEMSETSQEILHLVKIADVF